MAGAHVQDWTSGTLSGATSDSVTISGATSGNLLVAVISHNSGGNTFSATGWTNRGEANTSGTHAIAFFDRIATGDSNDNFAPSWTTGGRTGTVVREYSGLDSTTPLESVSTLNLGLNISAATGHGTNSATPTTANGLAVAVLSIDDNDNWMADVTLASSLSISNSFLNIGIGGQTTATNRPNSAIAEKVYTSTAAQSATWTGDGGSTSTVIAAMLVYKEPSAGGSIIPQIMHNRRMQQG